MRNRRTSLRPDPPPKLFILRGESDTDWVLSVTDDDPADEMDDGELVAVYELKELRVCKVTKSLHEVPQSAHVESATSDEATKPTEAKI